MAHAIFDMDKGTIETSEKSLGYFYHDRCHYITEGDIEVKDGIATSAEFCQMIRDTFCIPVRKFELTLGTKCEHGRKITGIIYL